ncbi:HAD family hydrolase [Bacillus sp. JJ1764]|uniref:HAD family hydrolase n=1 Tax=Bacillus sp. JJ1764 TaxID=3122964 RepID=UPI002FFFBE65
MDHLQLVIFDMDGLLFDTERISFSAMKTIIEKQGFFFTLENYKSMIGLGSAEELDHLYKGLYGKDFPTHLVLDDYDTLLIQLVKEETNIIKKGVVNLLDAIDRRGLKKCIASSSSRNTIEFYLSISGLTERFDFYVSGEEVENGKPHPDIFLEACTRANVSPENVLVLEDSLNGLRAANSAKMRCIIIPDLIEKNVEMDKSAYAIFSDLEQVIPILPN